MQQVTIYNAQSSNMLCSAAAEPPKDTPIQELAKQALVRSSFNYLTDPLLFTPIFTCLTAADLSRLARVSHFFRHLVANSDYFKDILVAGKTSPERIEQFIKQPFCDPWCDWTLQRELFYQLKQKHSPLLLSFAKTLHEREPPSMQKIMQTIEYLQKILSEDLPDYATLNETCRLLVETMIENYHCFRSTHTPVEETLTTISKQLEEVIKKYQTSGYHYPEPQKLEGSALITQYQAEFEFQFSGSRYHFEGDPAFIYYNRRANNEALDLLIREKAALQCVFMQVLGLLYHSGPETIFVQNDIADQICVRVINYENIEFGHPEWGRKEQFSPLVIQATLLRKFLDIHLIQDEAEKAHTIEELRLLMRHPNVPKKMQTLTQYYIAFLQYSSSPNPERDLSAYSHFTQISSDFKPPHIFYAVWSEYYMARMIIEGRIFQDTTVTLSLLNKVDFSCKHLRSEIMKKMVEWTKFHLVSLLLDKSSWMASEGRIPIQMLLSLTYGFELDKKIIQQKTEAYRKILLEEANNELLPPKTRVKAFADFMQLSQQSIERSLIKKFSSDAKRQHLSLFHSLFVSQFSPNSLSDYRFIIDGLIADNFDLQVIASFCKIIQEGLVKNQTMLSDKHELNEYRERISKWFVQIIENYRGLIESEVECKREDTDTSNPARDVLHVIRQLQAEIKYRYGIVMNIFSFKYLRVYNILDFYDYKIMRCDGKISSPMRTRATLRCLWMKVLELDNEIQFSEGYQMCDYIISTNLMQVLLEPTSESDAEELLGTVVEAKLIKIALRLFECKTKPFTDARALSPILRELKILAHDPYASQETRDTADFYFGAVQFDLPADPVKDAAAYAIFKRLLSNPGYMHFQYTIKIQYYMACMVAENRIQDDIRTALSRLRKCLSFADEIPHNFMGEHPSLLDMGPYLVSPLKGVQLFKKEATLINLLLALPDKTNKERAEICSEVSHMSYHVILNKIPYLHSLLADAKETRKSINFRLRAFYDFLVLNNTGDGFIEITEEHYDVFYTLIRKIRPDSEYVYNKNYRSASERESGKSVYKELQQAACALMGWHFPFQNDSATHLEQLFGKLFAEQPFSNLCEKTQLYIAYTGRSKPWRSCTFDSETTFQLLRDITTGPCEDHSIKEAAAFLMAVLNCSSRGGLMGQEETRQIFNKIVSVDSVHSSLVKAYANYYLAVAFDQADKQIEYNLLADAATNSDIFPRIRHSAKMFQLNVGITSLPNPSQPLMAELMKPLAKAIEKLSSCDGLVFDVEPWKQNHFFMPGICRHKNFMRDLQYMSQIALGRQLNLPFEALLEYVQGASHFYWALRSEQLNKLKLDLREPPCAYPSNLACLYNTCYDRRPELIPNYWDDLKTFIGEPSLRGTRVDTLDECWGVVNLFALQYDRYLSRIASKKEVCRVMQKILQHSGLHPIQKLQGKISLCKLIMSDDQVGESVRSKIGPLLAHLIQFSEEIGTTPDFEKLLDEKSLFTQLLAKLDALIG